MTCPSNSTIPRNLSGLGAISSSIDPRCGSALPEARELLAKLRMNQPGPQGVETEGTAMYAVLKTGGKQYRVAAGDVLKTEKLAGEVGESVEFDEILVVGGDDIRIGAPTVSGAVVRGEILEQTRDKKVINFVHRRRKASSRRKKGHRQYVTIVRINEISLPDDRKEASDD